MNSGNDQLTKAVRDAAQDGETIAPTGLIAAISNLEKPLQALQDMDQANEVFGAFDNEFGFVIFSFVANPIMPRAQIRPADQVRYASLLRWLIRELRAWREADDPRYDKLVALFVVAQTCDSGNALWELLPDELGNNSDLLDYLKRLIASFAVTFDARPGAEVPMWEGEAIEAFKRADAEGDWCAVIRGWEQVRFQLFFANTLQIQAVRILYRYSLARLIEGSSRLRQTPIVMQLAGVLTIEQRLRLAIASDSPHIQLAAMYRTLTDDRRPQSLSETNETLLTDLLLKAANDTPRWAAWMKIFASYPAVNLSLGRALAKVPDSAIAGYIDSIWLYSKPIKIDPGRQSVAECLQEFRANATQERRKALWTCAHERWLQWDFGRADPNLHMTAISWSDLDYALVGYAIECLNEAGREAASNAVSAEVQTLEDRWYTSFTDILAEWFRLLSRFQPYGHARSLAMTGDDWLPESRVYFPFEPSQNQYLMVKYSTTWPPNS